MKSILVYTLLAMFTMFSPKELGSAGALEGTVTMWNTEVKCQLEQANEELTITRDSLSILKLELKALKSSKKTSSRKKDNYKAQKIRFYETDYVLFSAGDRVKPYLDPNLQAALQAYNGPTIKLTSMFRPNAIHSLHSKGKAVDISWNESTKEMLAWTETQEGKDWMNTHSLKLYCENIPRKEKSMYRSRYRYIAWATGPHVHLELK